VATDEKNLLVSGHPISLAIWVVTALCLALGIKVALRRSETGNVPVYTVLAALGDILLAAIIGLFVFAMGTPITLVEKLHFGVGALCVPALLWCAISRMRRKPVFFGCFAVLTVFFALYMVLCVLGYHKPLDLLSFVAAAFYMLSVFQKKEQTMRLFLLGNMSTWAVYHLILRSTSFFAQLAGITSSVIALVRYRKGKKDGN
jgi:hypothetical protein